MERSMAKAIAIRIALCFVLGCALGGLLSEGSYQLNKNPADRDQAHRVVLEIPAGTADRLAKGQEVADIPTNMTFVVGDLLVVKNNDSVSHQLGPVWVPPQSSGVLSIDVADEYAYTCSFDKSQFFGLTVLPQLTLASRIQGALTVGLPTALILGLYSILVWPLNKKKAAQA